MGNKKSSPNFPKASSKNEMREKHHGRYNTPDYYRLNRDLGQNEFYKDERYQQAAANDDIDDEIGTGKIENYKGNGYYGSNYGSMNDMSRGRDYEWNAGYRDSYERLPRSQWPEVEEAARRRGRDPFHPELREDHRGKGPRNYTRSDTRILEDINDVLSEDPYIDATDIEVKVENGEVILTGVVENKFAKRRAEDLAESVSGIKHLENRLRPRKPNEIINIQNSEK